MQPQYDDPTYELIANPNYSKFNFPDINRYKYLPVYNLTGKTFFGTTDNIEIPTSNDDKYYQIKPGQEGRWDLISYKYYKTVNYWWLICIANDIYNPMESPPAGTLIRIPDINIINTLDNMNG